jgi:hypothetical protein
MIKLIKFFSIGLIAAAIILILAFVFYRNNPSSSSVTTTEEQGKDKGFKDIETAKAEMAKKNAQLMKSPLSQLLEEGKWTEARKMYANLSDDKFRQFMINRTTALFLQKNSALSKSTTAEELAGFMWDEYQKTKTVQNVAMLNIAKIALEYSKNLKDIQKKIEKKYYSIPMANNEKTSLLTALLSFRNDPARAILEDVRSKDDAVLMSAAIRALNGWKEPDISNKLLGIARKNKNPMVSAIAYKILAVNGERGVTADVEKLITNKNDMLQEAGLFIIIELKLKEYVPLVQKHIKDFGYFNRRFADQIVAWK